MAEPPTTIEGSFYCVEVGDDDDDEQHAAECYGPFADHEAAREWAVATLREDETRVLILVVPPALYAEQRRLDDEDEDDGEDGEDGDDTGEEE